MNVYASRCAHDAFVVFVFYEQQISQTRVSIEFRKRFSGSVQLHMHRGNVDYVRNGLESGLDGIGTPLGQNAIVNVYKPDLDSTVLCRKAVTGA